jgi:tetraacyldisaccharide 4'-kinase
LSQSRHDAYLRLIRGESRGLAAALARAALSTAMVGYRAAVALRNRGYDRGWLAVHRAGVPVVSVGNLTVGGTGKTPMVEWVARWFRRHEKRVVILSRGYRQVHGLNDEGRVLEENLPDVPHLQDRDRVRSARIAVEELEAEVLVLDDGFQHRRLARDLDVVLIDALEPFGLGRLLPRGLLREPVASLRRADLVVLSRADLISSDERDAIRSSVGGGSVPRSVPIRWVEARHTPLDLVDSEGASHLLEGLSGRTVAAFCGIGNPEGFRRTLLPLCGSLIDFRVFPDHHDYTAADVESLAAWARGLAADLVLTTQKDLVKLRTAQLGPAPLRALRIGLEIVAGEDVMEDALARLLRPALPD